MIPTNKLIGNWTNEGAVGGQPESHYLDISISVDKDNKITGRIRSRNLSSDKTLLTDILGKVSPNDILISIITDHENIRTIEKALLIYKNEMNLEWHLIQKGANTFPQNTILSKTEIKLFD